MRRVEGGDRAALAPLDRGREAAVDAALRAVRMHDVGRACGATCRATASVAGRSPGPIERAIGMRTTPSDSSAASAAIRSSSSAPPLTESQIRPTAWPASRLRGRKVGDVAKNAADRAPHDMDDGELLAAIADAFRTAVLGDLLAKAG